MAYRVPPGGLFAAGDTPLLNWLRPALRVSIINNDFAAPVNFVAPSVAWDWGEYDCGVRVGICTGVDITAEYARQDIRTRRGTLHPDEVLVTLRAAF